MPTAALPLFLARVWTPASEWLRPPGGEAETLYPKVSFSGLMRFQGWGQRNCYSLKGFHYPHLLVCWLSVVCKISNSLSVVCKISNSVSPINRTDQVSFLSYSPQRGVRASRSCSHFSTSHGLVYLLTGSVSHGIFHLGTIKSDFSPQETLGPGDAFCRKSFLSAASAGWGRQLPCVFPPNSGCTFYTAGQWVWPMGPSGLNAFSDEMIHLQSAKQECWSIHQRAFRS